MVKVAVHDLGGLSLALALRAETLAVSPPAEAIHAMRDIARDMRAISRGLHQLQSPPVMSSLYTRAPITVRAWFAENERFVRGVLGSGISLGVELGDGVLPYEHAAGLSCILFACCLDVRDRRGASSPTLLISAASATDAATVRMRLHVTCADARTPPLRARPTRWQRIARNTSARHGFAFDAVTPSTVVIETR